MPRDTNQRHREFRIVFARQNANAADVPGVAVAATQRKKNLSTVIGKKNIYII